MLDKRCSELAVGLVVTCARPARLWSQRRGWDLCLRSAPLEGWSPSRQSPISGHPVLTWRSLQHPGLLLPLLWLFLCWFLHPKKSLMLTKTEQSAVAVEQCPALPGGWGQQRAVEPQHRFPLGPWSCCRMGLTGRLVAARNAWGWARRGRGEPEEIPWGRSAGGGVGCGERGGSALLARCWLHPAGPRAAVGSLPVWKPGGAWPESSVLAVPRGVGTPKGRPLEVLGEAAERVEPQYEWGEVLA